MLAQKWDEHGCLPTGELPWHPAFHFVDTYRSEGPSTHLGNYTIRERKCTEDFKG